MSKTRYTVEYMGLEGEWAEILETEDYDKAWDEFRDHLLDGFEVRMQKTHTETIHYARTQKDY